MEIMLSKNKQTFVQQIDVYIYIVWYSLLQAATAGAKTWCILHVCSESLFHGFYGQYQANIIVKYS